MGLGDDQVVDLEVMVVFGVGDRGLQTLLDVDSDPLARKLQIGKCGRSLPAADQLRDKIKLLRLTRSIRAIALASLSGRLRSRFGLLIA